MSNYTEVIIAPKDLVDRTIVQMNVLVEYSNEVLLTGTIYNKECEPIQGAVIRVIEIYNKNHRVNKGYVITNQNGEFAIVVTKNDYINYQLDIYEPLITDCY